MLQRTKCSPLGGFLISSSVLFGCVAAVQNNPDTAAHFEHCVHRENGLDERSGWRDRDDKEINRICLAEAREHAGEPDPRPAERREDPVDVELEAARKRLAVRQVACAFQGFNDPVAQRQCEAEVNADRRLIEMQQFEHGQQEANRRLIAKLAAEEAAAERQAREAQVDQQRREAEARAAATAAADAAVASADAVRVERLRRAQADAKTAPPWICFQAAIGTQSTSWCAMAADQCAAKARSFAKTSGVAASITRQCEPQPLAACVTATAVLQGTQQTQCFASFADCEAYRGSLSSGSDYTGVTECEPTPTSWLVEAEGTSPFE